jgi:predicted ATPase
MSVTPMDEPESALSPQRQLDLLGLLDRINQSAVSQVIRATHSPILMAVPGARVLEIGRGASSTPISG